MLNFILSLLFFIAVPSEPQNDWQKSNLRGKPEKVITIKDNSLPVTEIYNKSGLIIHKENECICGCPQEKGCTVDYVYSNDNKLIESTITIKNRVIEKIAYSYKPNGEVVRNYLVGEEMSDEITPGGFGLVETKLKYDKYKNVKEEVNTNKNTSLKEIIKYDYIYDKQGNWIVKEASKKDFTENDFHKVGMTKREITYF
ncbi:hypothetical protein [Emticicia sp. C21]|uniref:hypothetical protein n=1 Tax=Emticicia sp. C21 TaxID=2302915 RepID=UPI000E341DBA|nr:hypothetical protein [Emticicia sp. C21]RFS15059.1 hypothetical protein D0T08_18450 [Emticicia sp. C21]